MEEELDTRMMMTELIGSLAVVYFAARFAMPGSPSLCGQCECCDTCANRRRS